MYHNRDFLLLGKSGNGKSSTGNSILQWNLFPVGNDMSSKTSDADSGCGGYNEFALKVVDMPGPKDNRMSKLEQAIHLAKQLHVAILLNLEGFHAFLIVVKFGNTWTEEEQNVVDVLKFLLDEDIVKNYCILVMTGGDNFERDEQDFNTWCGAQTGPFKDLINECGGRVVLFDNKTTDKNKKDRQTDKLLRLVDSLPLRGERYTDQNFKAAARMLEIELGNWKRKSATCVYEEEVQRKVQDILQKVSLGGLTKAEFKQLDVKITEVLKEIREKDIGTGVLKGLVEKLESLKAAVANLDDAEKLRKEVQVIAEKIKIEHNKVRKLFRESVTSFGPSAVGVAAQADLSDTKFSYHDQHWRIGDELVRTEKFKQIFVERFRQDQDDQGKQKKAKIEQTMKKRFGQDQDDQGKQN